MTAVYKDRSTTYGTVQRFRISRMGHGDDDKVLGDYVAEAIQLNGADAGWAIIQIASEETVFARIGDVAEFNLGPEAKVLSITATYFRLTSRTYKRQLLVFGETDLDGALAIYHDKPERGKGIFVDMQ